MASAFASTSAYIFTNIQSPTSPLPASRDFTSRRTSQPFSIDSDQTDSESEDGDEYIDKESSETWRQRSTFEGELDQPRSRRKAFHCRYEGCGKVYSRQSRLEEHERTHSGERPFECSECSATFTRISHLKAHVRAHASDSEKPYACPESGCEKKFWTNQHLKKHIEVMHHGKTYNCTQCDEKFRKHHQLRSHFAEVHCTPGTKPFLCDYPGCERSFGQKVHLKAHVKTHDPSRYVCMHPDCASRPLAERQFPLWSHLQKHTKTAHPPTCPFPACQGKTFTTPRGLKNHIAIHERESAKGEEGKDFADPSQRSSVKRKRSERRKKRERKEREQATLIKMEETDEPVAVLSHSGEEEDLRGEDDGEWLLRQESERDERMRQDFRIGGKKKRKVYEDPHGLTQDPACRTREESIPSPAILPVPATLASEPSSVPTASAPSQTLSRSSPWSSTRHIASQLFDSLTGSGYSAASQPLSTPGSSGKGQGLLRKYPCPFPAILGLPFESVRGGRTPTPCTPQHSSPGGSPREQGGEEHEDDSEGTCSYWFKRIYDVERHLRSKHGVEMIDSKETLRIWYAELELAQVDDGSCGS